MLPISKQYGIPLISADPSIDASTLSNNERLQIGVEGNLEANIDRVADVASREKICLILGSEGQGLSEKAKEESFPVSIPMPGEMESLNVAVAGGILLYLLK